MNVAHTPTQSLQGAATMSEPVPNSAGKAVDGNTLQEIPYCAVMDNTKNYNFVWWKVTLGKRFNVAYLEMYFVKNSMLIVFFSFFQCF